MQIELIRNLIDRFGLPLHVYFPGMVAQSAENFISVAKRLYPNIQVDFAVKSNPCVGALHTAKRLGLGVDVVSEFELSAAIECDFLPEAIVCNGNAKTDPYIKMAVDFGATIAVDSLDELTLIAAYSSREKKRANILIRLSGMDLDGLTSQDQSTAGHWTKFGIPYENWKSAFKVATALPSIKLMGISAHIGTQICDPSGYRRLLKSMISVYEQAFDLGITLTHIDIGGGFPLNYIDETGWLDFRGKLALQRRGAPHNEWVTWGEIGMGCNSENWQGKAYWTEFPGAKMLEHLLEYTPDNGKTVADRLRTIGEPKLMIEPGRGLFGEAGITLAEVIGVKEVEGNYLVILNLGIVNHGTVLVTPDIYPMRILPEKPDDRHVEVFVAGRLCFTGDMISKVKIPLNRMPIRGDIIAIGMTGAYCADHFASNSCGFPRPPKVAVLEDGSIEIWRKGESEQEVFCEIVNCKL